MMRAMVLDGFGGPDVLHLAEIERPRAAPGNVVVEVAYAGVNPADWKSREGWLAQYFDYTFPFVVGFDAAGIVAEVGAGVDHLAVGDRVVTSGNQGMGERGSYAEYLHATADRTIALPDSVSLRDAATLPTAGMTAWEATIDVGKAGPGAMVVVNGGAGGTGSFAIQIAKLVGATVAATCSARNLDYVRALGADHAIDYRDGNVYSAIRAWAPQGVDLVVDTVGQGTLTGVVNLMKRGGIVAPIGTLIADEPAIDPGEAQAAGVTVIPTISNFVNQARQLRALVDALASGRLRTPEIAEKPVVVPRFRNKIAGATLHRFDREINRRPCRHDHDWQRVIERLDTRNHLEPFLPGSCVARVIQIHDQECVIALLQRLKYSGERSDRVGLMSLALEQNAQRLQHIVLVVGDQNAAHVIWGFRFANSGKVFESPSRFA